MNSPLSHNSPALNPITHLTAHRALIEKIKGQLANESRFSSFRAESAQFMRGELGAAAYHERLVSLGLLGLTAELAQLCPMPERRDALLEAHKWVWAYGCLSGLGLCSWAGGQGELARRPRD